ncbi:MAG: WG repeat-containing protein [Reichenbachiella sp.]
MANKSRQALKALKEGEYDKVIEYLEKSVERDSLNPNTEYVYALLFLTDSFPDYNVVKSRQHILLGIHLLKDMNEEHEKEMEKSEILKEDFFEVLRKTALLAFENAKSENTISSIESYMVLFSDAEQYDEALEIRNELVFNQVEEIDTWQEYQKFITMYPNAKQVAVAQERFEKLVYSDKTKSGIKEDLELFLKKYPGTPFRNEIENDLYDLMILDLNPSDIYAFINEYDNSFLTLHSFKILYHRGELDEKKLDPRNLSSLKIFEDSIADLNRLNGSPWVPILEDDKYQFINLQGQTQHGLSFQGINASQYCGNITNDLLLIQKNENSLLVNRNGDSIYQGDINSFIDSDDGVIVLTVGGKTGAIHISGFQILPFDFEEVKWLGSKVFAAEKSGKMALYDFGGNQISAHNYDQISLVGSYWLFEKEGRIALSNYAEIENANGEFSISFDDNYEEVELIDKKYLIAFEGETEILFNEDLKQLSPPSTQRINTRLNTWIFQKPIGYQIFSKEKGEVEDEIYDKILQNKEWLGLKKNDKWEVRSKYLEDDPILAIDSLKLLGEDIAIIFRESEGSAIFPNKEIIHIEKGEYLTSIGDPGISNSHYLVVRREGENLVYKDGILLFQTSYPEVDFIDDNVFLVKENGKYGAVDEQGRLIMRVRYDAIGLAEKGVASVILDGKFGAYNFKDRILMKLEFEEKLSAYNEELYKVKEEGLYGILSKKNNLIVSPEFEEIAYWSDSTFWGKEDGKWMLLTMNEQKTLLEDVESFEYVKNENNEKIIKYVSGDGLGIYHSQLGLIIPPVYNDIYNLGNQEEALYFAEHSFPEADYYVVVYYNSLGEKIRTTGYTEAQFLKIVCDEP